MHRILWWLALACILTASSAFPQSPDYDESPTNEEPQFLSKPMRVTAKKGQTVTLPCQLDDLGSYALLWWHGKALLYANGVKLSSDPRITFSSHDLLIENINDQDSGNYSCQLSTADQKSLKHELLVELEPKVKASNKEVVESQGSTASLSCIVVQGVPRPVVSWKKDGEDLDWTGEEISIDSVDRRNSGKYTCIGNNGVGEASTDTIQLSVLYKPEIEVEEEWIHSGEGYQAEISCTIHGEPKPVVEWYRGSDKLDVTRNSQYKVVNDGSEYTLQIDLMDEQDFGLYMCSARNDQGHASKQVEVSGIAKNVEVTSPPNGMKADSYKLSWTVESYSPVLEYNVKYRRVRYNATVDYPGDWEQVTVQSESEVTGYTHNKSMQIPELVPATQYEATVQVKNKFGWNRESEPFRFATLGAEVPRPTPATSSGSGSLAVITPILLSFIAHLL